MSLRARHLIVVATVAIVAVGVRYYAREEAPHGANDGPRTEAKASETVAPSFATAGGAPDRSVPRPGTRDRTEDESQAAGGTDDQAVAAVTTPAERAVGGIGDLKAPLKVSVPTIPEFGQTLRQFAAERSDPSWSAATEARILREISQATGLSAGDVQVGCRTTLCRVLLTNPQFVPNARYRAFNELVASFGLKELWSFALPDENGTMFSVAYVQRGDASTAPSEAQ